MATATPTTKERWHLDDSHSDADDWDEPTDEILLATPRGATSTPPSKSTRTSTRAPSPTEVKMQFRDRLHAGRELAAHLAHYRGADAVVFALPRGGVPVGEEVARALRLPLDIVVVRKLGAPRQRELGLGAVAEGGAFSLDPRMVAAVGATREELEKVVARELVEVDRRVRRWRGLRPPLTVAGKIAIVVDDGVATGGTVRAALAAVRSRAARRIVLAVPVAPLDTLSELASEADEIVCVEAVERLYSVGAWYDDFGQVTGDEVAAILAGSQARRDAEGGEGGDGDDVDGAGADDDRSSRQME